MSNEQQEDRQHAPSQRRLDDARSRGDIARAPDLVTAATFLALLLTVSQAGQHIVQTFGTRAAYILANSDQLAALLSDDLKLAGNLILGQAMALLPLFLIPAAGAIAALILQKAVILTPEKLRPKLSRISPLSNAKQKFGREGLIGFAKSLAKMACISAILGWYLVSQAGLILNSASLSAGQASALLAEMLTEFLALACMVALVFGAIDFLWQKFEHLRRNRMSHDDLKREFKESEGDPHMRARRRQRAREIATRHMLREVASADVVVINPQHYAVALKWNRARRTAPVCVAKGVDQIAMRIREQASLASVPLHSDPATARALYATVGLGEQIRPEHYMAIAAAIRFADRVRKRRKGLIG